MLFVFVGMKLICGSCRYLIVNNNCSLLANYLGFIQ